MTPPRRTSWTCTTWTTPQAAGIPYIGHTELLAALTGKERVTTMLAMYHDQGHIPIKTHGFERSVTVALAHKRVV